MFISSADGDVKKSMTKILIPKLLFFLLFCETDVSAQENSWKILSEVSFHVLKDKNGFEIEKPVFSNKLRSHAGKTIALKGYTIPMNELNGTKSFMFSALPFSTCYFCGGAGPETVVEIESRSEIRFSNEPIIIEGILFLNDSDPDHHMYILKNAVKIK
jgi:hypothetical protein